MYETLEIPSKYNKCPGHLKMIEAKYLYNAPFRLGDGNYGNIGTYKGRSTVALAAGVIESKINGKVIAVDILNYNAVNNFKKLNVYQAIDFSTKGSVAVAEDFEDATFQMIFIDGDHTYEGIKADFEAWQSKIVEGGELAFHDSDCDGVDSHGNVGKVKPFLQELTSQGEWSQVGRVHTLSWWMRVK